jgi:hypothetical protein
MRIESFHSESRRVPPVDRQTRQDQRRKDEDRSERKQQEDAYVLDLTRGKVQRSSPFISGAYTRMGAVSSRKSETPPEPTPLKAEPPEGIHPEASQDAATPDKRPRLDTYS